jgi:hypothetical protein
MQNNARVGGVLSIVSGALSVFWIAGTVASVVMFRFMFNSPFYRSGGVPPDELLTIMTAIYSVMAFFLVIADVLAIVGGIFGIRRRNWGLALAGSIAGTITFFPCGIPAIIFTSLGKPEFTYQGPPPAGDGSPPELVS